MTDPVEPTKESPTKETQPSPQGREVSNKELDEYLSNKIPSLLKLEPLLTITSALYAAGAALGVAGILAFAAHAYVKHLVDENLRNPDNAVGRYVESLSAKFTSEVDTAYYQQIV